MVLPRKNVIFLHRKIRQMFGNRVKEQNSHVTSAIY